MKVLFINQFFWPDSSATSQQLTDMAAELAARGMDVTVLCAEGGYASAGSTARPVGVRIVRVKARAFTRGTVGRLLAYFSFYLGAFFRGLTGERPDVVISLTTPPLISLIGTAIKIFKHSRHYIWEQDIYPDVALDLNYFKPSGIADRTVGLLADFSRHHADGVIALGECMKQRLVARGLPSCNIFIVENWANATAITPMLRPGDPDELVLLYSGNFGLAHDFDTLAGAMLALRPVLGERSRFRFLFVGSGEKRKQLAAFCEANEIGSLELRPYVPRDQLSEGLAAGDIGLVTQHEVCCGSVVPSKVYGILAAGRPVLFVGPRAATPALIVEQHACGWQIDPGDVDGLTHLLRLLADRPELVQQAGLRARQALVEFYDLPHSINRMAAILNAPLTASLQPEPVAFRPAGLT
jgi:colanic acid biosynthesis glycosyl transferase WcaI